MSVPTLVGALLASNVFGFMTKDETLGHIRFTNCQLAGPLCLEIKAEKSVSSIFSPLYFLQNPEVKVSNRQTKLYENITGSDGYLDYGANQLVIHQKDMDRVLDLTDFSEKVYPKR